MAGRVAANLFGGARRRATMALLSLVVCEVNESTEIRDDKSGKGKARCASPGQCGRQAGTYQPGHSARRITGWDRFPGTAAG